MTLLPAEEGKGATSAFYAPYDSRQEWWYLSNMTYPEIALFKQYDSQPSNSRPVLHGSVRLPDVPEGSPARESWECRVMVFHFAPECRDELRRFVKG